MFRKESRNIATFRANWEFFIGIALNGFNLQVKCRAAFVARNLIPVQLWTNQLTAATMTIEKVIAVLRLNVFTVLESKFSNRRAASPRTMSSNHTQTE
jgi:hypothetical protein